MTIGEETLNLDEIYESGHVRKASIVVLDGPDAGKQLELFTSGSWIGTGADCDLVISDDFVSRRHLQVLPRAEAVQLIDVGSRNGTFIGPVRVRDVSLTEDTTIRVGGTSLRLQFSSEDLAFAISRKTKFGSAIGKSASIRAVFAVLERASQSDVTVLIEGASGTGKDVLATSLHEESRRAAGPFVVVDCGSIPENLIESELFGHQKGAFTGATDSRAGAFAQADGGTIFLDEIGELPLALQPKLLRVLETRSFRPVGGTSTKTVDVRVVAATNRRLADSVREKTFREDLYYRLNVVQVRVPPLAERRDDIEHLAHLFFQRATRNEHAQLPQSLLSLLLSHNWPGNARELRNVVDRFATFDSTDPRLLFGEGAEERAVLLAPTPQAHFESLIELDYHEGKRRLIDEFHRIVLPEVVRRCEGSISEAAKKLGLPRTSLHRMLKNLEEPPVSEK